MDPRRVARSLYWQGYRVARIAEMLKVKPVTVHSWKRRDRWADTTPDERVALTIEERLMRLVAKEQKEGRDFKEIDLLNRQLNNIARRERYRDGGNETDLNPKVANRNAGPRKKPERNAVSQEEQEQLLEAFRDSLFGYQQVWHRAGEAERIRNILKSRQIGATWYFAREAFIDALTTGRNQIFLSASKAQAHVFKQYIVQFAKDAAGVELKGDPIVLPNGATLYFLGTNARTAQSYHGKGPGNFRNLFVYAPEGKKDGIQLLPVSEVAGKDEFWNIKSVTRDDQLASHRVPPQLMGIIPSNTGGFGDVEKAALVFARNEVKPLQDRLLAINEWVGEEVVRFDAYALQ
ncbi:Uncharacterized conserved protein [Ralstonia mannitolilytica]|nr:terminase family protein [Ralstonia mannitolilytica]SUD93284.1 Uncharacterized conserved protein [Ralstonia mannitolilytica]